MGLIGGMARTAVVAGTATAVSNRVSRRQANRWASQDQQAYEHEYYEQGQQAPPPQQYQQAPPPAAPPPAPAPPPVMVVQAPEAAPDTGSKLAQLQQLGDLKAQGILTDAEFEVQKQKILNS
jgi:hypothetical protein